jgi:hypothetical protein
MPRRDGIGDEEDVTDVLRIYSRGNLDRSVVALIN